MSLLWSGGHLVWQSGHLVWSSDAADCGCCAPSTPSGCLSGSLASAEALVVNAEITGVVVGAGGCADCADYNQSYALTWVEQLTLFGQGECCMWNYAFGDADPLKTVCGATYLTVTICYNGEQTQVNASLSGGGGTLVNWFPNVIAGTVSTAPGFSTTLLPNAGSGCDWSASSLEVSW